MKSTTSNVPKTIDAYLDDVPPEARATLQKIREAIHATAPDAVEGISYQMPAYKLNGRPLVAFAAFKNHCSFFPMSTAVIKKFEQDLERYDLSKGTIRFPMSKPLPKALVSKMVKARIAENEAKDKRKKR